MHQLALFEEDEKDNAFTAAMDKFVIDFGINAYYARILLARQKAEEEEGRTY